MGMGPAFDPRSIFRVGDVRLFCENPRLKNSFPKIFPQIPCRLVARRYNERDAAVWSYEDLRTGEVSTKHYEATCFSLNKLNEMEVLAWASK